MASIHQNCLVTHRHTTSAVLHRDRQLEPFYCPLLPSRTVTRCSAFSSRIHRVLNLMPSAFVQTVSSKTEVMIELVAQVGVLLLQRSSSFKGQRCSTVPANCSIAWLRLQWSLSGHIQCNTRLLGPIWCYGRLQGLMLLQICCWMVSVQRPSLSSVLPVVLPVLLLVQIV